MGHQCVLPRGVAARALVAVRRVQRHPLTQKTVRTGTRIQKKVIRSAILSVIPSGIDDVVLHHAQFTIDEAIHLVVDQASISAMTGLLALILVLSQE